MGMIKRFRDAFLYSADLEQRCSGAGVARRGVAMYRENALFSAVRELGTWWRRDGRYGAAALVDKVEEVTSGISSYSAGVRTAAAAALLASTLALGAQARPAAAQSAPRTYAASSGTARAPPQRAAAPRRAEASGEVCDTCAPHPEYGVIPAFSVKGIAQGTDAPRSYLVSLPRKERCDPACAQLPAFVGSVEIEIPRLTRVQRDAGLEYRLLGAPGATRKGGSYEVTAKNIEGRSGRLVLQLYNPHPGPGDCSPVIASSPVCVTIAKAPAPGPAAPSQPPPSPQAPTAPVSPAPLARPQAPSAQGPLGGEISLIASSGDVANHLAQRLPSGAWKELGLGTPWAFTDMSLRYHSVSPHANVTAEIGVGKLATPGDREQGRAFGPEQVTTTHASLNAYVSTGGKVGPVLHAGASTYSNTFGAGRKDKDSGASGTVGLGVRAGRMDRSTLMVTYEATTSNAQGTGPLAGEFTGRGFSAFGRLRWGAQRPGSVEARFSTLTPDRQRFGAYNLAMGDSTTLAIDLRQNLTQHFGVDASVRSEATQWRIGGEHGARAVSATGTRAGIGIHYSF